MSNMYAVNQRLVNLQDCYEARKENKNINIPEHNNPFEDGISRVTLEDCKKEIQEKIEFIHQIDNAQA